MARVPAPGKRPAPTRQETTDLPNPRSPNGTADPRTVPAGSMNHRP